MKLCVVYVSIVYRSVVIPLVCYKMRLLVLLDAYCILRPTLPLRFTKLGLSMLSIPLSLHSPCVPELSGLCNVLYLTLACLSSLYCKEWRRREESGGEENWEEDSVEGLG